MRKRGPIQTDWFVQALFWWTATVHIRTDNIIKFYFFAAIPVIKRQEQVVIVDIYRIDKVLD